MTAKSTAAEDRLAKLGIYLPDAPTPFGAYVPALQTGNLLFLSGMLATSGAFEASDRLALVGGSIGQVVASGDGGSSDALEDAWTGTVTDTIVQ